MPGTASSADSTGAPASCSAARLAPDGLARILCDDEPVTRSSAAAPRDPLIGIERLLVDGTNLLHAMSARSGPAPAPALVGRVRAVIPGTVRIELLFDGPPEPGMRGIRIAHGVTVRYSGRISADTLAVRLVTEATGGHPEHGTPPTLLVVTDDGRLASELRARGAATIGASWLIRRLDRPVLASASSGRPRPPAPAMPGNSPSAPDRDDEAVRPGWSPGRGATRKRGNAHRVSRSGDTHR